MQALRTNWQTDKRSFSDALQVWRHDLKLTRKQAAEALNVPVSTLNGWIANRPCAHEKAFRKLMTLIARE